MVEVINFQIYCSKVYDENVKKNYRIKNQKTKISEKIYVVTMYSSLYIIENIKFSFL